jgi:methylenetetrahydrofolate reductase (NADPH)
VPPPDAWAKPVLERLLTETDAFVIAVELVTSRGLITDQRSRRVLRLARELAPHPRIDVLSITDNPAGNAMLAADTLGTDLISRGQEVIIHLACKDWNRNALQSRAWKLSSEGFHNVLALSGDYPAGGWKGAAAPVFDIDSVGLLRMLSDMNEGLEIAQPGGPELERTQFFPGAVVTNHKRHEREVIPQYLKLRKKIENGARFVINQIGYHARKDDELLKWMHGAGLEPPVLANVFVLSPGAARAFNAGRVPGVVVTDELLEVIQRYSGGADRGRSFFLELAAKQVAVARGLGFRGAYIGGHLEAGDYVEILDRAGSYAPDAWPALAREVNFAMPGEFHYFERDEDTGLSSTTVNREYERSRRHRNRLEAPLRYRLARRIHAAVFAPEAPLHKSAARAFVVADGAPRPVGRSLHALEQAIKVPMFGCQDCGDCSLPDVAYLCPESQCAKNQRNGPCGGTRDGKCEVGEKECIWALAYERLKPYGQETTMLDGPAVIKDNALRGTSAWTNTFLGRDHAANQEVHGR